jgi:hypothetical protein
MEQIRISDFKMQADNNHIAYQNAAPYPHIVLDNFLNKDSALKGSELFPEIEGDGWIHYLHVNEKKHGLNKKELLPDFFKDLIEELHSNKFVSQLEKLTGIKNLIADEMLEGGGLHQSATGGFLNVHADFTVHPHKRKWKRRVNLLIYFNEDWKEEYLGGLEMWDTKMKKAVQTISPFLNRCIIFNTEADSFHGFPEPIKCPEGMTRKSLALYYFTKEDAPVKRATNYKSRPGDGIKSLWIYLDKQAINCYTFLKGLLGLNDDFASNVLKWLSRKK